MAQEAEIHETKIGTKRYDPHFEIGFQAESDGKYWVRFSVGILTGGIWITQEEIEQIKACIEHAMSDKDTSLSES